MNSKNKEVKERIKDLPVNLSVMSLALLLNFAERGNLTLLEILDNSYLDDEKNSEIRDIWDYCDELKKFKESSARTTLWRLQKRGFLKKKEKFFQLTPLGLEIVNAFKEEDLEEKEWDGKWRIVMFDIPEKKRQHRNWLRFELYSLDYKLVQKSVFMGKWPIEEDIYQEIMNRKLDDCIRLLTVGEIDDDEIFKHFEDF